MRIRKPTLRAQLASESNELLVACLDLKRPGSLYSSECQGLAVLADLCQTVLCERSKKQAAAEAQCLASGRSEPYKQVRTTKRKLQDAEAGETYKAQYEWGYVPMKRRRAVSPADFCLQPATPSSHRPTQSIDSTQLEVPSTPVSRLVQLCHQGTQISPKAHEHQHGASASPVSALRQHAACQQQHIGPSSTVSLLPASSASDVTTLYCNEELVDSMDNAAVTQKLHASQFQPLQAHHPSKLGSLPTASPPSSAAANQLISVQHARQIPVRGHAEQPPVYTPLDSLRVVPETPVSTGQDLGAICQGSADTLQHQFSGGAMECAQILSGAWGACSPVADHSPEPARSLCPSPQADAKRCVETDVPRVKSAGGGPQCGFCLTRDTPQWRDGPGGTRTACNACSTAWQRAGRPMGPWLPGRVARIRSAQAAPASTAAAAAV